MRHPYLTHFKVDHFGCMSHRLVGPFGPHLNVVFGRNEAGKTTLSAFAGGVLFGWEEARGARNTYKPQDAERVGSLLFAEDGKELRLSRARNADGLCGDVRLAEDIDKSTFSTMFSLTSDELRGLKDAADVTARLLTAGAGTACSPAHALRQVNEALALCTSRSAQARSSVVRLTRERDEAREKMRAAADEAARYRRQDKELCELESSRRTASARIEQLNVEVEGLSTCRAGVERIEEEAASLNAELQRLHDEERRAVASKRSHEQAIGRELARMSGAQDRCARERLDALADEQARLSGECERARASLESAEIDCAAVQEAQNLSRMGQTGVKRTTQIAVTSLLFALLVVLGVPLFMHGRSAGSLSYMSLGLVMVAFGMVLAAAAFVLLFRPSREGEQQHDLLQQANLERAQSAKRFEAAQAACSAYAQQIEEELAEMGLAGAGGLIRRARVLLDEAKDVRAEIALDKQRQVSATCRVEEVHARLEALSAERARLCERAGMPASATYAAIDERLSACLHERAELQEELESMSHTCGELKHELAQAHHLHEFDRMKMRCAELDTRVGEATREFAKLLLARRMLQEAIATWQAKSQPEVYERASRCLSRMTEGRWTSVRVSSEGQLHVVDDQGADREPRLLSLGTCQQLYLALRIALLSCAANVGRAIPVLADDILVNFDAARRVGAARALVELSRQRQVILFTCHEEVVHVLEEVAREAGMPAVLVEL